MKPSTNCYEFITKEERVVLHPYLDSAGVPTIGIGTTMYPDGRKVTMSDHPITLEKANEYLAWEVNLKSRSVNAFLSRITIAQNAFDALVSFAYNVGVGGLQTSRLLKTVLSGENKTQPVELMDDHSVKDWFTKQGIRAVPQITYYFSLWCKITVKGKDGKERKILSEGLIKRRLREAALFHRS